MHTYEARVIADQATGRPLAGVRVTVEDAETGVPVQPYRDGAPVQLVTGTYGLITEWQTDETTRRVALTAGSVRLTQWCEELQGTAADAVSLMDERLADAASAANQAADIRDGLEPRVRAVEIHAKLAPGVPEDGQTASFILQSDAQTRSAVEGVASRVTVDTLGRTVGMVTVEPPLTFETLQAAAAQAAESGRTLAVSGELTTDQTLVLRCSTQMHGLTIRYTGDTVAVQVGTATASLRRQSGSLPRVIDARKPPAPGWRTDVVGLALVNVDACVFYVPQVQDFGVGLDMVGDMRGNAYNTITVGHLANNRVNNRLRATPGGWANSNVLIGGRYGHNSAEGNRIAGVRHIQLVPSANAINNNVWINASVEGNTPEYHLEASGSYNNWVSCRWEASQGPRVLWRDGAVYNVISYGYQAHLITEAHEGTSGARASNRIESAVSQRLRAGSEKALLRLANLSSAARPADAIFEPTQWDAPIESASVVRSALYTDMKRAADAHPRMRLDHANGRMYLGNGNIAPDLFLGSANGIPALSGAPTALTAPSAPLGYVRAVVNGTVVRMPYYADKDA